MQGHVEGEQERVKKAEESADYYLDRIEELTHNLSQAEVKLKAYDEEKAQQSAKVGGSFIDRSFLFLS